MTDRMSLLYRVLAVLRGRAVSSRPAPPASSP